MTNPYIYREPVPGQHGFFNRSSEITRIASRIAADRPQSVSVVGGPRTGKTSLLNYLCDPAKMQEYLEDPSRYLYLRLALKEHTPKDPDHFFQLLGKAVEEKASLSMSPSYEGFSELVKQLMQAGQKLVVFFDDFEQVTLHAGFPVDFFSFMRSIANSNDVGYVTTSYDSLQRLCHTETIEESPFFNIFTTVNLEPFRAEEARRLVEDPAAAAGAAFGPEVDWVLELGGVSPYLLQLAAAVAFEARAQGGLGKEALAEKVFAEAHPYLELIWGSHFPEAQKEVMQAVASGKAVERRHQYAADSLERRGFLRKQGEGYLVVPSLMARFLKNGSRNGFWKRIFG